MSAGKEYKLGIRNPNTLPGPQGNESHHENDRATARWHQLLRWVQTSGAHGYRYTT